MTKRKKNYILRSYHVSPSHDVKVKQAAKKEDKSESQIIRELIEKK